MRNQSKGSLITLALVATMAAGAITWLSVRQTSGQAGTAARPARTPDGKPNFNGIWQALNEANWDLQAHEALPARVTQPGVYPYAYTRVPAAPVLALGAVGGVPGSIGVVEGDGQIPYTPAALATKKENADHWIDRDPELKCFVPGVPRALYLPYPFQITQSVSRVQQSFEFANTARTIYMDKVDEPPADSAMGHSLGHWEGDTLVVDAKMFNDNTWFDRAGNFHSDQLHIVERYSPITPDAIHYEVTIEDPQVFTRPWKISMPLYRRLEPNAQLMEYNCVEFVEEFMYGHARKNQLVKHWEGENMIIDIKRFIPPVDVRNKR